VVVQPPLSDLSVVFLLAAGLLFAVAVVALRLGPRTRVTEIFLLLVVADGVWAASSVLPLEAATVSAALVGETLRITTGSVAALTWFTFAVVYTGRESLLSRRRLLVLAVPFVVHVLAFVTNPLHGLAVRGLTVSVRPVATVVSYEFGPVFLLVTLYALALTLVGTALVVETALTGAGLYVDQSIALFAGAIMPIVGTALTVAGVAAVGSTNLTPATLTFTALGLGYALFRTDLLTTGPLVAAEGRKTAVESLEEGFLIADSEGRIVETNAAARTLLGTSAITGEPLTGVLPDGDVLADGRRTFRTDDGTVLEARITPMGDGGRRDVGQVMTVRDVTGQRRRQERLQVLNRVLRHNLRNDLTVVRGVARELPENEALDEERVARIITEQTDGLLDIVDKVRTVEELLAVEDTADREPVALSSVVADEVAAVVDDADRPVEVVTDGPDTCRIRSNRNVLALVLGELLTNAVEHNDSPEPTVWVSVTVDEDVVLRIADDGPGIPEPDRMAVLSGTETPLDHASHLGLWMVRWGVRYLGGELAIETRSPSGTVVEIRLANATPVD